MSESLTKTSQTGGKFPADHAVMAARGVEFTQEPTERPYGTEALFRDDSGNWFSFTQRGA